MPLEDKIDLLVKEFGAFGTKLETLDSKVSTLDSKVTVIDGKVDKLQIRMDETHQLAKLGLEAVEGLRESTADKFADMTRQNAEQTDLLKSVLVHVRKRVERIESVPPPKRRRRS